MMMACQKTRDGEFLPNRVQITACWWFADEAFHQHVVSDNSIKGQFTLPLIYLIAVT